MKPALEEAIWLTTNLPIRMFGDPILMTACAPVTAEEFASAQVKTWNHELNTFMTKYRAHTGLGRGLAANQIGISKQIVWIWDGQKPSFFYNPHITGTDDEAIYPESCISSAALMIGDVKRAWAITLEYQTETGDQKTGTFDGLLARLLQHEIDHLAGHVCSDHYLPDTIRMATADKTAILAPELKRLS